MIGVVVNESELEVVREFFELFKTPWEQAEAGRRYPVAIVESDGVEVVEASVLIHYGSEENAFDRQDGEEMVRLSGPVDVEWRGEAFPVYGNVRTFSVGNQDEILHCCERTVGYRSSREGRVIWRIGYDLFDEIRYLLTKGQPATYALMPTLERHIELLRYILIESKVAFVEIPPRPAGYDFICCLTHDIDFYGIRRHLFDRTMAGFLYRALIGSVIDLVRGHRSFVEVGKNWLAVASLPLVFLGVLSDFWRPFYDYAKAEDIRKSTFFVVPFKGRPGIAPDGSVNAWRATPYGIRDVHEEVQRAASSGSELGIHGIDAWRDVDAGREELRQLTLLTGQKNTGIRMHWLYSDDGSPMQLDKAGFDYDSTWGYNETVGYRAGTAQTFRPFGCKTLVELPMSIMDSALFSTGRMSLGKEEAQGLCRHLLANMKRYGGALVINWHERSLAPERLWGQAYNELLSDVRKEGRAWFVTAGEAVQWFRWRRSISFRNEGKGTNGSSLQVMASVGHHGPSGVVCIYGPELSAMEQREMSLEGDSLLQITN